MDVGSDVLHLITESHPKWLTESCPTNHSFFLNNGVAHGMEMMRERVRRLQEAYRGYRSEEDLEVLEEETMA
jgi:hypothetical protein